jgi:hypothetical protein
VTPVPRATVTTTFLAFLPRWTAASRKCLPEDYWRLNVNRTPDATRVSRVWLRKSGHARETDHERYRLAMCVVRRDVQSTDHSRAQRRVSRGVIATTFRSYQISGTGKAQDPEEPGTLSCSIQRFKHLAGGVGWARVAMEGSLAHCRTTRLARRPQPRSIGAGVTLNSAPDTHARGGPPSPPRRRLRPRGSSHRPEGLQQRKVRARWIRA